MGNSINIKDYLANAGSQIRLSITFGVFLSLILILGTLLLSGMFKDLRTVEQENRGIEMIASMRPLLESLPRHRGRCSVYRQGDSSFRVPCLKATEDVEHSISKLAQIDALQIRPQFETIQAEWMQIKGQLDDLPPAVVLFSKDSQLIAKVVELGRDGAESSSLIYDSNTRVHSLVEIVVFRLPMLSDVIGKLRGWGSAAAAAGWVDEQTATELAILTDQVRRSNVQLMHEIENLGRQDLKHAGSIKIVANEVVSQIDEFLVSTSTEQLMGNYFDVPAEKIFASGSFTIDAVFKLYDVVVRQLEESLLKRKHEIKRDLLLSALSLVLVLFLTVVLFILLSRSLRQVQVSERRLSSVFNTVADGLVVVDQDWKIRSFNPSAEKIFGYGLAEVIGHDITLLVPKEFHSMHEDYLRQYQESGDTPITGVEREIHGLHKSGRVFPMELTVSTAKSQGVNMFTAVVRDITKRKHADAVMEKQRRLIETISNAQSGFIAGGNPLKLFQGMLADVLELVDSEFGFIAEKREDQDGKTFLKLFAQSNIAWDEASREFYKQNVDVGLEFHNMNTLFGYVIRSGKAVISSDPSSDPRSSGIPGGHPPLDNFLGVPIYLGSQLVGMIGLANRSEGYDESVIELLQPILSTCAQVLNAVAKEVEQRRTALELKRSNSFMSALVENLQAGLLVEDEAGRIYGLNQTYREMFSMLDQSLLCDGESCLKEFEYKQFLFSQPEDFLLLREECLAGVKAVTGNELVLLDGRVFEQDYVPIIFDGDGGRTHRSHLWTYRDISEHKRIEKTLSLAKENAESAARAKSQFLATMSHEIRTPMNGVLGMLNLLEKTGLSSKQKRFVGTATSSGEILLNVINDILDFSKLEAEKLELECIRFDLIDLLEQCTALMAKSAHDNGVELMCSITSDMPRYVKGDPTRLRQVLSNLVNNAVKFTEQGDIVLYSNMLDDGRIQFGVRDTGIGMTEYQHEKLFQAFSQVDDSHTRKYGGTGLGLAISQKLVLAMGGKIRVASALGVGSDFNFDIALDIIDYENDQPKTIDGLSNCHILLVDDNSTLRELLKNILASWGVTLIEMAVNGVDALAKLREAVESGQPFDIAVLDLRMPVMSGHELIQKIRSDSELQNMKLMLLSAVDPGNSADEVDVCLSKPVLQDDLRNGFLQLLNKSGVKQEIIKPFSYSFNNKKLLLVEDNQVNQEVACEILIDAGFEVDVCENGADAVKAVQNSVYDVVLMDIQMPIMDGLEATQKIRSLGGIYSNLPILAMTANALSGDSDKSLAAGMNAHITKPISPDVLFQELSKWLECSPDMGEKDITEDKSDVSAQLPELPGIDIQDGLSRLRGNWPTYKRILLKFAEKQAGAADLI